VSELPGSAIVERPDAMRCGVDGRSDPITVLIVDDHTLMRSALRLLLETSLGHRVTEVSSAQDAVHTVASERFDVVLLDVRMPGKDGLWALERIRDVRPRLPVIMLSCFADEACVREALSLGAVGYLLKDAKLDQVADSITTALSGEGVYLHPMVAGYLLPRPQARSSEELTEREHEVLALLVEGATNEEIADALYITEKTVKTHLSAVFRKLGATNRTQAATKAIRQGLVAHDQARATPSAGR
jgi:DNA-binding NarL/FixJ family response regulator